MVIIQIDPLESGQHPIQSQSGRQSCWMEGYIEVPAHLEAAAWESLGWCELTIEDGILTGITPTERPDPEPGPEPEAPVTWEALASAIREGVNAV